LAEPPPTHPTEYPPEQVEQVLTTAAPLSVLADDSASYELPPFVIGVGDGPDVGIGVDVGWMVVGIGVEVGTPLADNIFTATSVERFGTLIVKEPFDGVTV